MGPSLGPRRQRVPKADRWTGAGSQMLRLTIGWGWTNFLAKRAVMSPQVSLGAAAQEQSDSAPTQYFNVHEAKT